DRDKALYEADAEEGLGVLVRVPRALEDLDPARIRRDLDFELEGVLDLPLAGLPEPLDVVDWPVAIPEGAACVPLLVLADPHAAPLPERVAASPPPILWRLGRELLG